MINKTKVILSINGEPCSSVQLQDYGISTTAVLGDHQVTLRIEENGNIDVDMSHLSKVGCSICGRPRIEIKKDLWLCPGMEDSPMHWFGPRYPGETIEQREQRFSEFLASKGCSLEEYRKARERQMELEEEKNGE